MTSDTFARYRDVVVAGGTLRIYEAGPHGATPVILLHGAMLDTAPLIWRHLMPVLARQRRVIAVDMPRHGGSRPWGGTVDQPRLDRVVTGLLDHLGLTAVHLVGLSMGGGVAIGVALNHPDRVRSLTLAAPGGLDAVRPWQFVTWLMLRSNLLMRWVARWLAASPSVLRRTMVSSLAAGERTRDFAAIMDLVEAEARARRDHGEGALDDWQITAYGPRRMRLHHTPELHRLTAPSLWIHGRLDRLVPEETVRQAAATAPDARFERLEDAGHLSPLDQPERFAELVTSFLARVDQGARRR